MKNKILISEEAQKDIEKAITWYDDQKLGLGKRLIREIRSNIKFIQKNPLACPIWYNEIHVTILKTFPYSIHYYHDKSNKVIFISGLFKHEQNPENGLKEYNLDKHHAFIYQRINQRNEPLFVATCA